MKVCFARLGFLLCLWLVCCSQAFAQADWLREQTSGNDEFLPVEQAFQIDFTQSKSTSNEVKVHFSIAPEYYLYQHRFGFEAANDNDIQFASEPQFPSGIDHEDEFFGKSIIYRNSVTLTLDIASAEQDAPLVISYQGCADAGLCYPPTDYTIYLNEVKGDGDAVNSISFEQITENSQQSSRIAGFELNLADASLIWITAVFILLGIGLAFTPCVFPMYPILSGIIVGANKQQALTKARAFRLSLAYVLGMAVTYTALGIVVALAGVRMQAALQHPVLLLGLAVIFTLLAAAMFGAYQLSLPQAWVNKMTNVSNQRRGGATFSVFLMGAISGLIASPCTTAPLSGILLFIAQSGDLWIGGSALFALSIGMGLPLLALGISGGHWLPKAGSWMDTVKFVFGFLLLAVALFMLERVWISPFTAWLWIGLFCGAAMTLTYRLVQLTNSARGAALTTVLIGILWLGSAIGIQNQWHITANSVEHLEMQQVSSLTELKQAVAQAQAEGQPVMLDLYADWCVACKEFERYTFTDPKVQQALQDYRVLQADVTQNNQTNTDLLEHYQVLGLPTILFFDAKGNERSQERVTGFMDADAFHQHLEQLSNQP